MIDDIAAEQPSISGVQPLVYRPAEAAAALGVSLQMIYKHLRAGTIPARKLGDSTLILRSDLSAVLEALPRAEFAPRVTSKKGVT